MPHLHRKKPPVQYVRCEMEGCGTVLAHPRYLQVCLSNCTVPLQIFVPVVLPEVFHQYISILQYLLNINQTLFLDLFQSSNLLIALMLMYSSEFSLIFTSAPYKISAFAQEEICMSSPVLWKTFPPSETATASRKAPHRYTYSDYVLCLICSCWN